MRVAGIFLTANEARIITLIGTKEQHKLGTSQVNKLSLSKNPSKDEVEVFVQAFKAYCSDNGIDKLCVNRRLTSGKGASGAGTFIIEGILLAVSSIPIEFIHSATVRATDKSDGIKKVHKPKTADLGKAYDLGFEGLN